MPRVSNADAVCMYTPLEALVESCHGPPCDGTVHSSEGWGVPAVFVTWTAQRTSSTALRNPAWFANDRNPLDSTTSTSSQPSAANFSLTIRRHDTVKRFQWHARTGRGN